MATKILVLGHRGMLGNAVFKYFSSLLGYETLTLEARFGDDNFIEEIREVSPHYIINCIGIIPQRKPDDALYEKTNIELPVILEKLNIPVVLPSTDCEFSGHIGVDEKYTKDDIRDAEDAYGKSKAIISEKVETSFKNTKIIRTSIIGHEERTHLSLLDWFLNSEYKVNGYTNHYWNGITTLEWAKQCKNLIENWGTMPTLNQYSTDDIFSKYDLLNNIKNIYRKDIEIIPFNALETINKCLASDKKIKPIKQQLSELKIFYKK